VLKFFRLAIDRLHHSLTQKQFLLVSSVMVGLLSGSAAIVLKFSVHWLNERVTHYARDYQQFFLFTFLPLIGIALSVTYVRRVLRSDFKKGTAEIVYAIAKKSGVIAAKQIPGHIITSALTVGFGGSMGLESPMVSTGSAIGSAYAQSFRLTHKERTVLLACGAAAGIAAAFNSPIAGVLFAVEVLLVDIAISAFIPLIIAAASGALLSKIILKEGVLLTFTLQQPFDYTNVPYYVILGVLCGAVSLYYVRMFTRIQSGMARIEKPYARVGIGGLLLAGLLIIFPSLFGEGYESIKVVAGLHPDDLIRNSVLFPFIHHEFEVLIFLAAIALIKVVAAAITLGAGGNGGNFAPSLFVGAYLGFVFSRTINLLGLGHIPESNFTLVAMAGILSGIFYAPLTAIFLIAEITGGYGLMIPLMIVSALSVTVARHFEPLSMEAKKLSGKLKLSLEDRDKYLLSKLDFSALIETEFEQVRPDGTLGDLVSAISASQRNIFPVVDATQQLVGIIRLDDVREIIFNRDKYEKTVLSTLMQNPSTVISRNDDLHTVLQKFDETGDWNLPVADEGRYVGFVSKSSILARYRSELVSTM
jgi:CIC family chloride channel protein